MFLIPRFHKEPHYMKFNNLYSLFSFFYIRISTKKPQYSIFLKEIFTQMFV